MVRGASNTGGRGRARRRRHRTGHGAALAGVTLGLGAALLTVSPAHAEPPDPTNAAIMSATATLMPVAVGTTLLLTERGDQEGVRLASGLSSITLGVVLGPYTGQVYAGAGVDGVVTLVLRSLTGGLAVTGTTLLLRGDEDQRDAATAMVVLGGIPAVALAVYDIWKAPDTARESRVRFSSRAEHRELASVARCGPIPCGR